MTQCVWCPSSGVTKSSETYHGNSARREIAAVSSRAPDNIEEPFRVIASFRFGLDLQSRSILTLMRTDPYNSDGRAMTESSRLPRPRRERGRAAKLLRVAAERHS